MCVLWRVAAGCRFWRRHRNRNREESPLEISRFEQSQRRLTRFLDRGFWAFFYASTPCFLLHLVDGIFSSTLHGRISGTTRGQPNSVEQNPVASSYFLLDEKSCVFFVPNRKLRVKHLPCLKLGLGRWLEATKWEWVVAMVGEIFVFFFALLFFRSVLAPLRTIVLVYLLWLMENIIILVDRQHIIIILQGFKHPN